MSENTHGMKCISASALLAVAVIALVAVSLMTPSLKQRNVTAAPISPSKPQATLILPDTTITPLRDIPNVNVSKLVIPNNTGRGVIAMIGSAEDALRTGLGVVQITAVGPCKIHAIPGKPVTVKIRVTYMGGPSAPATVALSLNGKSSLTSVSYVFIPLQNVDPGKVPSGMKPFTVHKPVVYRYSTAGSDGTSTPHYVIMGYKDVTGYYIPSYDLLSFSTGHVILHRNSSVIIEAKLTIPDYVRSGTYYISPSLGIDGEHLYVEEDAEISVTVSS